MEKSMYGYKVTVPELRQRNVEELRMGMYELHPGEVPAAVFNGDTLRVAARLAWVVKESVSDPDDGVPLGRLTEEATGDMFPYVVQGLATVISDAYLAVFKIPGE